MASAAVPLLDRPLSERAFVALNRRGLDTKRHPVVLLDQDLDALDAVTGSRRRSQDALRQLLRDGRIRRVRRGVYLLAELTGATSAGVLPIVDAVTPRPYLVTAGRALAEFSLTDQHFFRVVVLTSHRLHGWSWQGDEVRYAFVAPQRIWGLYTPNGPRIAVPERAILDSLAHPGWGVTLPQVAEAVDRVVRSRRAEPGNLARAAKRYGKPAVTRRLGYLLELLHGRDVAAPLLPLIGASHARVLLSPSAPNEGPTDAVWRLRINVDPDVLLAHRTVG